MNQSKTLSTAQFEHGMPILAELSLANLFDAFFNLRAELPGVDFGGDAKVVLGQVLANPKALKIFLPLLETAGQAGKVRILRRVSAVVNATDDELIEAERSPAKLQELEDKAAKRSYLDTAQDLLSFFSRLGLSASVSRTSSTEETEKTETQASDPGPSPDATRSGVS